MTALERINQLKDARIRELAAQAEEAKRQEQDAKQREAEKFEEGVRRALETHDALWLLEFRHPLEIVQLTDRFPIPEDNEGGTIREWSWFTRRGLDGFTSEEVEFPESLWRHLRGDCSGVVDEDGHTKNYRTRDDALAAMSRACLEYARYSPKEPSS